MATCFIAIQSKVFFSPQNWVKFSFCALQPCFFFLTPVCNEEPSHCPLCHTQGMKVMYINLEKEMKEGRRRLEEIEGKSGSLGWDAFQFHTPSKFAQLKPDPG